MLESTVILAALAVISGITGALIWLLKKLFTQNEGVLKGVSESMNNLAATLDQANEGRYEFRHKVVTTLGEVHEKVSQLVDNKGEQQWRKYHQNKK